MLLLIWTAALIRRRTGRLIAIATAIALAVALLASLGAFISHSKATMTKRAAATVDVDWQIAVQPGGDPAAVLAAVRHQPGVQAALTVAFAQSAGYSATTGSTTQTTGPGVALGLPDHYRATFPDAIRDLSGSATGVLLAQQTASNLHAAPGNTVMIGRAGMAPIAVTVSGVIDLPQADSLFQKVGAATGSQPQAPPDNVMLMPASAWHRVFDPLQARRPDLTTVQIHARLDHHLAADPAVAYSDVLGRANNMEVKLAGSGLVGNNLAATLGAARSDALYAQVLFVFLGLPGVVLAGLLTATVADAGAARRRREQALLRTRGATTRQLVQLALTETALVATVGSALGIGLALAIGTAAFHEATFGTTTLSAIGWAIASTLAAITIAAGAVTWPAWRDAHGTTVTEARRSVGRHGLPLWARFRLDIWLLVGGGIIFWLSSRNGYQLVLAPEGVPTISVSYWAFAGPALIWIGTGLFTWRAGELFLRRGRRALESAIQPISGPLADTVAATMQRQRHMLTRGVVLVALTVSFAASSAVFNATYRQQASVDALLSNGADVTVTEPPGSTVPVSFANQLAALPDVHHVETLQHRYAYVGADLQDLFGVDPTTIVHATKLQDAFFQGGTARELMATLERRPDNILVSSETVKDFQLQPGDVIRLRIRNATTNQLRTVAFHYAGIGKEFPTAPRDSFLIANRAYIAQQTGSDAIGAFLLDTNGINPSRVAQNARRLVGTAATVTDITATKQLVGSSLTAVDLSGLTKVELGFALALAAAASGLVLWLGFAERRRTFAIAAALGATPRQLGGFVWSEAGYIAIAGLAAGALSGWALSEMLVRVLTGVFDPPPATLAVPWRYLAFTAAIALAAICTAAASAIRTATRPTIAILREN